MSNMVLVLTTFFKSELKIKIFSGDKFSPFTEEIITGMLVIIKENENFNEKKMDYKGSSVIVNTFDQNAANVPIGDHRTPRPFNPYKVNNHLYYQDIENDIHIDDHDFYIKNWSKLIADIILFFATYFTKPAIRRKVKISQDLL